MHFMENWAYMFWDLGEKLTWFKDFESKGKLLSESCRIFVQGIGEINALSFREHRPSRGASSIYSAMIEQYPRFVPLVSICWYSV